MKLTDNAIIVLEKRYLARDEQGNVIETPDELFKRVAHAIASADVGFLSESEIKASEKDFYDMMVNLEFLPNSPTLMNAGRPLGQLSACFVLPIEDSMESIFETVKNAALIHKSGGGTGFSFSNIRGKGSPVKTTGGVASGPISFMKVFNGATEAVKQGGTRRGANMGILRVDHPDIMEFISCKSDIQDITNFNISVGVTEKFMEAVEQGTEFELVDPHTKKVITKLNGEKVFNKIVENAWKTGEPGIVFLDRINKENTVPGAGEVESTNPCGEQPLLPYESCNLGSINLLAMMNEEKSEFDYEKLKKTIKKAVHFLDNVIDINKYPHKLIDEMTKATRKIGLGVMGWADSLYLLGIPYNSQKAVELGRTIMRFINNESKKASIGLAEIKGVFPYYDKSVFKEQEIRIRNATTTTIAPTGTLSIIAGISSGIEPVFAISYIRNVMDNAELVEVNPLFKKVLEEKNIYSEDLMKKIANNGTIVHMEEFDEEIKAVFVTSHDISPEWHIKMQAVFQESTDNAVSKTVNLKKEATLEDVKDVFLQAYSLGCKGVTLYRDGSRDAQVLNIGKVNNQKNQTHIPKPRPEVTNGFTQKYKTGCGNLYVTVNSDEDGNICEVFTNTGRAGGCPSQSEATSRLVSIALRSGIPPKEIIAQLKGIRCASTIRQKGLKVLSCPDAIGRLIEKVEKSNVNSEKESAQVNTTFDVEKEQIVDKFTRKCPECGRDMEHEGGCVTCRYCGYSKCG